MERATGLRVKIVRALAKSLLAAILALGIAYGMDTAWAVYRGKPGAVVKVDRYYTDRNRWNETEYSVGTPEMQPCIYSVFPHFGAEPCWYTTEHTLRRVDTSS